MVMIKNRKTVKGKLGNTRPKDTDFAGIARKQSKKKKTEQKKSQTKKVSFGRQISKKKQKMGMGKGKKGLGMLNVMTGQQANQPSGMKAGGKTSKYRMAGGGKTSKYRMKGGGKTSKYMAKGGKTSKYMRRGGKVK